MTRSVGDVCARTRALVFCHEMSAESGVSSLKPPALGLLPTVWERHTRVRRQPGPQRLNINDIVALAACAVLAMNGFVLSRGFT